MPRLCCFYSFACEDCQAKGHTRNTPALLPQFSNRLCRHLARLMSHAGAMDEYNSIEGLLAPAREGALRPLSGRYLMELAAGQRSLKWSSLVLGIDTISSPLFVVGSSMSCRQCDLSRLSPLTSRRGQLQRLQDLPERAFYFPADDELANLQDWRKKFFFIALSYRWLSQGSWWGRRKLRFNC